MIYSPWPTRLASAVLASCAVAALAACAQSGRPPPQSADPIVQPPASSSPVADAFARADTNGDGKLSLEETAALPPVAARFKELDTDSDGFLNLREFSTGYVVRS